MTDVRQKLATGEPLDFLAYVSTLVAALDPRAENPFEYASQQPVVSLPELVGSFADVELPETAALLAALAVLGPDELGRARARQAFMDAVMTSERECGCYPQVPGLGICQLARHEGIDAVLVTPWRWDGRERHRVDLAAV